MPTKFVTHGVIVINVSGIDNKNHILLGENGDTDINPGSLNLILN